MSYQVTQSFFKVDKRGNHKLISEGTVITNAEYLKLNAMKRAKCEYVEPTKRQVPLSQDEADDLVYLYLNVADLNEILTTFLTEYPKRVSEGIECQLRIIAGCDNTRPNDGGLRNPGKALLRAMITQDPARFV